jgi:hypothetical protein
VVEQYKGGRTFRELKNYVVSMKSEKDLLKEEKADPANAVVLDGKNFKNPSK